MEKVTYSINELFASSWEQAIDNVIEIMSKTSFRILSRRNDWAQAQSYALEKNIRFDVNGNIVNK